MKRNPDLIRHILLECEKCPANERLTNAEIKLDECNEWEISEHIKLLLDARFINASISQELSNTRPHACYIYSITWDGYEYLDTIRNPEIWSKTKKTIVDIGGSLSIELIKAVAKQAITEKLGIEI